MYQNPVLFDHHIIMPHVTREDKLRLGLYLANNTKLWKWLTTRPSEEDLWKAYAIEASSLNPRPRLMGPIVNQVLHKMRDRLRATNAIPTRTQKQKRI